LAITFSCQLAAASLGIRYVASELRQSPFRFHIFTIVYTAIFISVLYPIPRYVSPLSPVIDGLAAMGLITILQKFQEKKPVPTAQVTL